MCVLVYHLDRMTELPYNSRAGIIFLIFWLDRWVGDVPLCRRFSRLFNLAENELATVASMCSLGWKVGGRAWQWRRRLWVWEEEMLEECRIFLSNVFLQLNVSDTWQWQPDPAGGYSVRSSYEVLTPQDHHVLDAAQNLIWHPQVPLKVSILAWRLLRDRLPAKFNLLNRGIITVADISCVTGCGHVESVDHLFLHCNFFGAIWCQVRLWLGFSGVDHDIIGDHFLHFTYYLGGMKTRRSFLKLFWLFCVWLFWKERNNIIFNNITTPIEELVEKVKFHSYWWLCANNAAFVYGCQQWQSNPLLCLGID